MAKKKKAPKKKSPKKKKAPKKSKATAKRQIQTEALLMAEAASRIKAGDCAAYAVYMFNEGELPEGWEQLSLEAVKKFMIFGWTAYHALGGLSVDWDKAAENILKKLKALPQKKPKPRTSKTRTQRA